MTIGTIVVGVDGSDHSRRALQWAFAEARAHTAEIRAVSAWLMPPPLEGPYGAFNWEPDVRPEEDTRQMLATTLKEVCGDNPPVAVKDAVCQGNAAKVLIDQSKGADLLVVGSRGHGGFFGLLLGSVSMQVVSHAACTVVVVR